MKVRFSARLFATTCGVVLCAHGLVAQTTVQLFGPVDPAKSISTATYSAPYGFNTTTLSLTCTASPIQATLSSPNDGNLLVDNNIIVTVTPANEPAQAAVNICPVTDWLGQAGLYYENCFTSTYASAVNSGSIYGLDPDTDSIPGGPAGTIDAVGGVAPISLVMPIVPILDPSGSANNLPTDPNAVSPVGLVPGTQSVTIALEDEGGQVASSSIFLNTNCILNGVSSGTVSGNPISADNSQSLTQTFTFNSNPGGGTILPQIVSFVYDVSQVASGSLNGSTPQTTDAPLAIGDFPTKYAINTSFATSSCLIHQGEVLSDGVTPACKLYTLKCISPTDGSIAGANCPISAELNEVVGDFFDGPQFSLQNVYTPYGVFHQGIGFLMASDTWAPPGGPCTFDADLSTVPCPQNLLINFSGPGIFKSTGVMTEPNSTYVSVAGVPEDHTSVVVAGQWPDYWVNTLSPNVSFTSQAPNFSKGASVLNSHNKLVSLAGFKNYIPAPIHTITYGISAPNSVPSPATEPIIGDNTVVNPALVTNGCPVPSADSLGPNVQPNFATGPEQVTFPGEGQYLLHYYAQDCAGTQELQFTLNNINNVPTWSTSFYTIPVNIDTTPPSVDNLTITTKGAPYRIGQILTATFSCSDKSGGAGVVLCGSNKYAPQTKYTDAQIGTLKLNFIANSSGKFTVYATDGAGNTGSAQVTYTHK